MQFQLFLVESCGLSFFSRGKRLKPFQSVVYSVVNPLSTAKDEGNHSNQYWYPIWISENMPHVCSLCIRIQALYNVLRRRCTHFRMLESFPNWRFVDEVAVAAACGRCMQLQLATLELDGSTVADPVSNGGSSTLYSYVRLGRAERVCQ